LFALENVREELAPQTYNPKKQPVSIGVPSICELHSCVGTGICQIIARTGTLETMIYGLEHKAGQGRSDVKQKASILFDLIPARLHPLQVRRTVKPKNGYDDFCTGFSSVHTLKRHEQCQIYLYWPNQWLDHA
jgi:hypothetical protein